MIAHGGYVEKLQAARLTLFILDEKHRRAWTHKMTIDKIITDLDYYIETANVRSKEQIEDIWVTTRGILESQDIQIFSLKRSIQ